MKNITIQDIAREAGVGKSTVSRVITGKGYVSEEKAHLVREVMERHNYRPSAAARSLSTQRSETIGLILPEVNNPFFADILKGISQKADEGGYTLMLSGSDNRVDKDLQALRAMRSQRVKGLVYIPAGDYNKELDFQLMNAELEQLKCPIVFVDRSIVRLQSRYDCVTTDNYAGAYAATETLIEAGHRRIGIVTGDMDLLIGRERYEGFVKALEDHGLSLYSRDVIYGEFDSEITYACMKKLFAAKDYPKAFFLTNTLSEQGFLKAASESGLKIPDDIAFVGFDFIQGQDLLNLSFTCLEREILFMGEQAAQLLIQRFESPDRPAQRVVIIPHVVKRGSEVRKY